MYESQLKLKLLMIPAAVAHVNSPTPPPPTVHYCPTSSSPLSFPLLDHPAFILADWVIKSPKANIKFSLNVVYRVYNTDLGNKKKEEISSVHDV